MDELPVKSLASVDSFHSRLDETFDRLPALRGAWGMGRVRGRVPVGRRRKAGCRRPPVLLVSYFRAPF